MKVVKRITLKTLILLAVIAVSVGASVFWQAFRQRTPDHTIELYLSHLIENEGDQAFALLDQAEYGMIDEAEYKRALEKEKYSLYSDCEIEEFGYRRDENGKEYADYHVKFKDADGEIKLEQDISLRKQENAVFGIFDRWKVSAGHSMVRDYKIRVAAGSELYLNNEKADSIWCEKDETQPFAEDYTIPSLILGENNVSVRHSIFKQIDRTITAEDEGMDFTGEIALKDSAKKLCMELGVKALKELFVSSARETLEDSEGLFNECQKSAQDFVKRQTEEFYQENDVLKTVAVSNFQTEFGEPEITEKENGAVQVEMQLSFDYKVRMDEVSDTELLRDDGTPIQRVEAHSYTGNRTAVFEMTWYDETWHITSVKIPELSENMSGDAA